MVSEYLLEDMANDYFREALDRKNHNDIEHAIAYFSIAYGFYRQVENVDLMKLSVRWLAQLRLDDYQLKQQMNYGFGMAQFAIDVVNAVNKIFSHTEP